MISMALKCIESVAKHGRASVWATPRIRAFAHRTAQLMLDRHNARVKKELISGRRANLDDIASFLRTNAVPLNQPLVLISQVQRSGGSLLNQLFDAHPALAVYPGEIKFGSVDPDQWTPLDARIDADENFCSMLDLKLGRWVGRGYVKGGGKRVSDEEIRLIDRGVQRHRFLCVPHVQCAIFKELFESSPPNNQKAILDHYFTAFFGGWLDYQGHLCVKKWITAFAPRLAHNEANMVEFFNSYSGGRLIQIVRNPMTWYPSALRHRRTVMRGTTSQELLESWCESAESVLRNKERYGDAVIVLSFEDLVGHTESTMRRLARELSIDYDPILLKPTFNGQPIGANSSFAVEKVGVIKAPLAREKMLSRDDRKLVENQCSKLYESVAAMTLNVGSQPQRVSGGT